MTATCKCNNCDWSGPEEELRRQLDEVPRLEERIAPGETVPAGECPKCGALASVCQPQPTPRTETTPSAKDLHLDHFANLGRIVVALANHEVGDYGDCNPNDPMLNLIDDRRPADELIQMLAALSEDEAAILVGQLWE